MNSLGECCFCLFILEALSVSIMLSTFQPILLPPGWIYKQSQLILLNIFFSNGPVLVTLITVFLLLAIFAMYYDVQCIVMHIVLAET